MAEDNEIGRIILEEIRDVRDGQLEHTKILVALQKDVSQNTEDLEEHIEGVIGNRKRIEHLEKPYDLFKTLIKITITAGAVAGAIYAIMRLIEPQSPLL